MTNPIPERLAALRAVMRERGIAFCIVPTADPHLSEYLPDRWRAREWLSGFTGSAGTLIVGADFAGLWTDSRYFEQAMRELDNSSIELMRLNVPHAPEHLQWLREHVLSGERVACAADMLSMASARALRRAIEPRDAKLALEDLPDTIWADRPCLPRASIYEHPIEFAVRGRSEKLIAVRDAMRETGTTHHLVSALDEIAWLTNLRGSDIEYNPVFLAHLLIDINDATLFVDAGKLDARLRSELRDAGFKLADYPATGDALASLPKGTALLLDPQHIAASTAAPIPQSARLIEAASPIALLKARKNEAELSHVREAMRRDGVALVCGARWIEESLARDGRISELDVDAKLRELRARQPGFVSESFSTIAGYEANAALPHYHATPDNHAQLRPRGMLLIDSGGQYLGGTTDITRVWALGETTAEQRRDVTLVLKGVIALSRARFPRGASGQQLDALARAPIWAAGLDYGHGTGHGVGYCLNVHEGPQAIRPPRSHSQLERLEIGMITSIEPGVYKSGRHGVRIENLVAVVSAEITESGEFLAFETLTLCPIDTRLLDRDLLEDSEIAWLDAYHAMVRERLAPLLDNSADRHWLATRCVPLDEKASAP